MRFKRMQSLLAGAAIAAGVTAGGSPAVVPGVPAIYVDYNADCTFTLSVDGGISITSTAPPGPTLPPGTYQVLVWLPNPNMGYSCGIPTFTLTGPGVNSVTVFRGQELHDEQLATLQPSSTYSALDTNAPDATRRVFTTAASGSNSGLLGSGTQSSPTGTSVQADIVGSATLPYRGRLVAGVSAAGAATLKLGGREVDSLKAGKYDIRVDDADARGGFFVQRRSRKPVTVTTLAFVGKRTEKLVLTTGTWTFFTKVGPPTRFTVVG